MRDPSAPKRRPSEAERIQDFGCAPSSAMGRVARVLMVASAGSESLKANRAPQAERASRKDRPSRFSSGFDRAVYLEQCVREQRMTPEVAGWLRRGLLQWRAGDGARSLDECLGLPTNKKLRIEARDHYLAEAAQLAGGEGPRHRAASLFAAINRFDRGPWRTWRELERPPGTATALEQACFWVLRWGFTWKSEAGARKVIEQVLKRKRLGRESSDARPHPRSASTHEGFDMSETTGVASCSADPQRGPRDAARQAWAASARIRDEFLDDFSLYMAYTGAVLEGRLRVEGPMQTSIEKS